MSYDLHITRQKNWVDNDNALKISFEEWIKYVSDDPDMRLDNFAEAQLPDGNTLRVESDGLSVWTKYSQYAISGNQAWFDYYNGRIVVKNPDDEIINKMLDIAAHMNATVQGDEGEFYQRSATGGITNNQSSENTETINQNKPWWKFW